MEHAGRLYLRSDGAVVDELERVIAEPRQPRPDAPLFVHPGSARGRDFMMHGWHFYHLADGGVVMEREKQTKDMDGVIRAHVTASQTFSAAEWEAFTQVFVLAPGEPEKLCGATSPDPRYLCVAPADHLEGKHEWRERA
jgi:hypothetical protein